MKTKSILFLIFLLTPILTDRFNYNVSKDAKTGKYKLIFNEEKPAKVHKKMTAPKSPRKTKVIKKSKKPKRKLVSEVGAGLMGAGAGAVVGGLLSGASDTTKQIIELRPQVRNLQLKNMVEKDNNSLLFKANMELKKVFGDLQTMRETFVFLLEQKKNMLIEVLPDVSVRRR